MGASSLTPYDRRAVPRDRMTYRVTAVRQQGTRQRKATQGKARHKQVKGNARQGKASKQASKSKARQGKGRLVVSQLDYSGEGKCVLWFGQMYVCGMLAWMWLMMRVESNRVKYDDDKIERMLMSFGKPPVNMTTNNNNNTSDVMLYALRAHWCVCVDRILTKQVHTHTYNIQASNKYTYNIQHTSRQQVSNVRQHDTAQTSIVHLYHAFVQVCFHGTDRISRKRDFFLFSPPPPSSPPLKEFENQRTETNGCLDQKIRNIQCSIQTKQRQDKTRQDKTRQDKTRHDKTWQDMTRHDKTRHKSSPSTRTQKFTSQSHQNHPRFLDLGVLKWKTKKNA
jgi:hypothetical protein